LPANDWHTSTPGAAHTGRNRRFCLLICSTSPLRRPWHDKWCNHRWQENSCEVRRCPSKVGRAGLGVSLLFPPAANVNRIYAFLITSGPSTHPTYPLLLASLNFAPHPAHRKLIPTLTSKKPSALNEVPEFPVAPSHLSHHERNQDSPAGPPAHDPLPGQAQRPFQYVTADGHCMHQLLTIALQRSTTHPTFTRPLPVPRSPSLSHPTGRRHSNTAP
jgi:hypothetical protein